MGELLQQLNYYGFEKETFDECRELIYKSNQSHAMIINLWFALINAFYCLSAGLGLFNVEPAKQGFFFVFMVAAFLNMGLVSLAGKRHSVFGVVSTVADVVMFEVYSILSSNSEPYSTFFHDGAAFESQSGSASDCAGAV